MNIFPLVAFSTQGFLQTTTRNNNKMEEDHRGENERDGCDTRGFIEKKTDVKLTCVSGAAEVWMEIDQSGSTGGGA